MKITNENIKNLSISSGEQALLESLLVDLDDINNFIEEPLYIDFQDWHNEYSPERIDPCPDYYGMYTVKRNGKTIGIEMTIGDLDLVICVLYQFLINDEVD